MNRHSIIVISLILTCAFPVAAQPRRRTSGQRTTTRPATQPVETKSTSAAVPPSPPASPADSSEALAIVNDVTLTAADIESTVSSKILNDPDLYLQAFYQDREKAIREARQRAVDARVNSMLIAAEAKKRGMTTDQFLDSEVNSKVASPTDAEVRAVYDANRAQLGADLEAVRPTIVNYIRAERSQQAHAELVNRLKMTNTVMKNADVNAPNLAPGTVIVSVNGQPLRIETLNERMKAYIFKMDTRIYEARKQALDRRINDSLVLAEASKRKIGPEEIVRTEITDKLKDPTEAEVAKFYEENKARLSGDLNSLKAQIAGYLQSQQQEKLERDLATRLRAGAKIQILLKEPAPPFFNLTAGKGVSRGDVNAPVKIIEFTDFQCSACGAMYPVLEDAVKSFGNRVYFEVRNFPLSSIHPNAMRAAQAAAAANAQGKFWQYIDFLFKNQNALDDASLKKYATQAGLDRQRFDADLDSGRFDAAIRRDIEEGESYGIEGTPTIYINGVVLTTLGADSLREAIENATTRAGKTN
ncbi:MAG TPA: thioredoxin domain-containing protein [Pyrinomonadaceae bacterium]|nr:thioredoxin domain-containing protein [Pyrinomonadaceae bacterium]